MEDSVFGSKEINAVFSLEKDRTSFYGLCSQRPKSGHQICTKAINHVSE